MMNSDGVLLVGSQISAIGLYAFCNKGLIGFFTPRNGFFLADFDGFSDCIELGTVTSKRKFFISIQVFLKKLK